jgi:acyl-CoA oxidase
MAQLESLSFCKRSLACGSRLICPVSDCFADPRRFMAQLESLSFCDYSMAIKAGVHFTLCGGTICKLGTAKHHEALLPRLNTLDLPGCFGMTELGHGSNVMGIETTVRATSFCL